MNERKKLTLILVCQKTTTIASSQRCVEFMMILIKAAFVITGHPLFKIFSRLSRSNLKVCLPTLQLTIYIVFNICKKKFPLLEISYMFFVLLQTLYFFHLPIIVYKNLQYAYLVQISEAVKNSIIYFIFSLMLQCKNAR